MVSTSAGLTFMAGGDIKVRAYDEERGKVLWTAKLPTQAWRRAGMRKSVATERIRRFCAA
jgi:glucose dehydrogenase